MKNLKKILMVAVFAIMVSCSKDGAVGPAGINGTNGTNGANGANGNANVQEFNSSTVFTLSTITGISKNFTLPIPQTTIDSSIVLGFFKATGYPGWYPCPGLGPNQSYQIKTLIFPSTLNTEYRFIILNSNGSDYSGGTVSFDKVRIFVIPSSSVTNLRTKKPLTQMTYDEVCELYNIPK